MAIKYSIIHILLFIFFFQIGHSQHITKEFSLIPSSVRNNVLHQDIDLSDFKNYEFIALSVILEGKDIDSESTSVQVSTQNRTFKLPPFGEDPIQSQKFVSELIYLTPSDAGMCSLSVIPAQDTDISDMNGKVRVFVPTGSKPISLLNKVNNTNELALTCECVQPNYVPRKDWGAGFKLTGDIYIPPAAYTKVTHLIVHHSAGTNVSNNWSAVVASIFDFHVSSNGWQDVGYNWLIDPNGVIYEGRGGGDNVRGAHMCGYNNNTMGVCLLGNFEVAQPTDTMMQSLTRLLSWKACKEGIMPDSSSQIVSYPGVMSHISGHKDGCSPNYTQCPGENLYTKLKAQRTNTTTYIASACQTVSDVINLPSNMFTIFPNPASTLLHVQNHDTKPNVIEVRDITGRILLTTSQITDTRELDISSLTDGLYYLSLKNGQQMSTAKFIKMNGE
jgi:hypothetical protein